MNIVGEMGNYLHVLKILFMILLDLEDELLDTMDLGLIPDEEYAGGDVDGE